jgi:outer membrane protein OmpA-like peptidoglycan-associated protein
MSAKTWLIAGLLATIALPAAAQQQPQAATTQDERGRVATTIDGDAGLWWLPVADTNGKSKHRGSVERNSRNTPQGLMNVATFTANVSYGFTERMDVYAGWDFITRVDRDNQVLFVPTDPERGGIDTRVPYANERWTGNKVGDLRVGAKYAFMSEGAGDPFSAAGRVTMNLPTGDADAGAGQGSIAADLTGVLSRWVTNKVVLTGSAGYNFRKNPSDPVTVHVPNNFHWGAGVGINPTPSWLIHGEILGDNPVRDNAAIDGPIVAEDGSISPAVSQVDHQTSFTTGVTWFADNGFFIGAEIRLDTPMPDRINASESSRSDYLDYHVRIGWSPRRFVPPPVIDTPPPPVTPPPARVHDLSVKAACDPCTVEVGKTSNVTAVPTSSISCVVSYAWSAPTGTFADRTQQKTIWTAPMVEGPVPVTVTVTCPTDNKTASDTVTIQVIRPAAKVYTFEDVHFDFDRYTLRPEALRVLEQAVSAMKEDANLRLTIEGNTCSIGTAEYNLALGERRANAVRDYLTQNGVAATRLQTVSYGEEKPKHDNGREETRRLNRRAALVVRLN